MRPPSRFRTTRLPPELMERVLALLASSSPADRTLASQLLARGFAQDEEDRQTHVPPTEVTDGYNEMEE
jgi:hypothetical protein